MNSRIGDYELLEELGRGGMGVVYRARHVQLDRVVALKVMLADADPESVAARRFSTEARAAAKLSHPNLVPVLDMGWERGRPYMVQEFVEGTTLSDRLRKGPLPEIEAAEVAEQMARAIGYAHSQGILHRDLKPENVILQSGRARVTDFGLARCLASEQQLTQTGTMLGTPSYASPELLDGDRSLVGPAADVYGLGATLFALLAGHPPFQGASQIQIVTAVLGTPAPLLSSVRPGVNPVLVEVCKRCLSKEPDDRYESAEALADALADYLRTGPHESTQRSPIPWVLGAVMCAGAIVGGLALTRGAKTERGPPPAAQRSPGEPRPSVTGTAGSVEVPDTKPSPAVTPSRPPASLAPPTWEHAGVKSPPPRDIHAAYYDPSIEEVVIFGGHQRGVLLNDMWSWDGKRWKQRTPKGPPRGRYDHGLAWDATRDTLVMFGGRFKDTLSKEVWELRDGTWESKGTPPGPVARVAHGMVYDPNLKEVVVFGGTAVGSHCLDDAWSWNGSDWRRLQVGGGPSPRAYAALLTEGEELLVYAGRGPNNKELTDLFAWRKDRGWRVVSRQTPAKGSRYPFLVSTQEGQLFYDPVRRTAWWRRGGRWTQIEAKVTPGVRHYATLTWDAKRRVAVLFGGRGAGGKPLQETWEYPGS